MAVAWACMAACSPARTPEDLGGVAQRPPVATAEASASATATAIAATARVVVASASAPAPAASSAPPAVEPAPTVVVALAEQASRQLEPTLPGVLGAPTRSCDADERCSWKFPRTEPGAPPEQLPTGWLWVDETTAAVRFATDSNDDEGMPVASFLAAKKLESKILEVVQKLPDVVQICRETRALGAPCMIFTSQMGREACPAKRGLGDSCLWGIYVGANMGTHSSRIATMLVDPSTLSVVGASDIACGAMPLKGFRARRAASKTAHPLEDCPGGF